MIIKKKFKEFYGVHENPTELQKLDPRFRVRENSARWKEFNKETTGKSGTFRLNAGKTREEFESWQENKFGNKI